MCFCLIHSFLSYFTQRPPYPQDRGREERFHRPKGHQHGMASPSPPGLLIRPAPRIVRELPPSLATYRVTLFFHALRLKSFYRVEYGCSEGNKKTVCNCALVMVFPKHTSTGVYERQNACANGFHLSPITATVKNITDQWMICLRSSCSFFATSDGIGAAFLESSAIFNKAGSTCGFSATK